MSETENLHEAPSESMPLPEANFEFLVFSLGLQAQQQLGLLPIPGEEGKFPADLTLARHTIDLLAVLQEKTKGNLTLQERRYLENSITELRYRYVQVSDSLKKNQEQVQS
jgi:uncharacterized protein DUF1844